MTQAKEQNGQIKGDSSRYLGPTKKAHSTRTLLVLNITLERHSGDLVRYGESGLILNIVVVGQSPIPCKT